jgi:threonine synthase
MAAAIGHKSVIFAPKTAPPAKVAQLLVYGAQVILVDGNYDAAFDLTIEAAESFGWYCRNTGFNPFTAEGKKTAAFEIWELMLEGRIKHSAEKPLSIFVSVGDGNIISGIHKGFRDLMITGHLSHMPRIFGIQSQGSAAVANAYFSETEEIKPVQANTLADSISVDLPRDGVRAIRAARDTAGAYLTVPDEKILEAIAALGPSGIFAEPAGAAAYAGLTAAVADGLITPDDPVMVINTGSGLKDVRAARQAVPEAPVISPHLDEVKKLLRL